MSVHAEPEVIDTADPRTTGQRVGSSALYAVTGAVTLKLLPVFTPSAFINAALRNGWKGLLAAIGGAALLLTLFAQFAPQQNRTLELIDAGRVVLEIGIPAVVAVAMLRRRMSSGAIVLAAVLASAAGLGCTELLVRSLGGPSVYAAFVEAIRQGMQELAKRATGGPIGPEIYLKLSDIITTRFMAATLANAWALSFVVGLILLPRDENGPQPGLEYLFRRLEFPQWLPFFFVAGGVAPLLQEPYRTVGLNILAVVLFLFLLQGVAIYRWMLARMSVGFFGLLLAFGLLLPLYYLAVVPLLLVGLFDPFFDFRHLHRKEEENESDLD